MTTLQEVCALVYEITARPDLVTLTKMCVRDAVRKAHALQDFDRDVAVVSLADYVAPAAIDTLEKQYVECNIPANMRQLIAVIATNEDGSKHDKFVPQGKLELFRYSYKPEPFTYEIRGTKIRIGFTTVPFAVEAKVRTYPALAFAIDAPATPEVNESWLLAADDYSFIVYSAAAAVYRAIGMNDDARGLDGQIQLSAVQVVNDYS